MPRESLAVRSLLRCFLLAAAVAASCAVVSCTSKGEEKVTLYSDQDPTYQNPFKLPEEWADYGIGDPYILRFDGKYYLYCSTKDNRPGIKGWRSEDLLHWKYEGLVTNDPLTMSAYAPEVVYWNGYFYMYTSPAGNGHYVLRSESPTGPFEVKTDNLGLSIDGSVFIDDDGKWYFSHAGTEGIVMHPMTDPYTIEPGKTLPAAYLGGWTEGSTVIKRNGAYYLTFTGNHVFSKGYRVGYGVSHDGPLGEYRVPDNNPVLIHTEGDFFGLGHSSTFPGPDLDSYYMVYHNLVGRSAEGPPVRQLDFDRLVFNGDRMNVLGPTNTPQPVPKQADFRSRLTESNAMKDWEQIDGQDGSRAIVSKAAAAAVFTAEYNFRLASPPADRDGWIKLLFAYESSDSYWSLRIDPVSHQLTVMQRDHGTEKNLASVDLGSAFDMTKLHTVRVENDGADLRIFFDSMQKFKLPVKLVEPGSIGYASQRVEPQYSYTAFSNDAGGSSDYEAYKTVPGTVEAVHYMKGNDRGFSVGNKVQGQIRSGDGVATQQTDDGSYSVTLPDKGDWLSYKIHVAEAGSYGVYLTVKPQEADAEVEISCEGAKLAYFIGKSPQSDWQDVKAGTIELPAGYHTLKIKVKKGTLAFSRLGLYRSQPVETQDVLQSVQADDFSGQFQSIEGGYQGSGGEDGRLFAGNSAWDDYELSLRVGIPQDFTGEGSVLVRTTNESVFPQQVTDSFMGYSVTISDGQIQLQKLNYDNMTVDSASVDTNPGVSYPLRIRLTGSHIQVYWNDSAKPVIDYTDPQAFFHGRVGLRSRQSNITFTEMKVKR